VCIDDRSDWYQWVTTPELIADDRLYITGDPIEDAPGMWETFEADFDRMQADRMNAYRMGVEWSRLFPDPASEAATSIEELAATADPEAVARYHQMFDALAARGITPMVTINHYSLPLWVHDGLACHRDPEGCVADGWLNRERILRLIALYAGFLAREYGDDVRLWATLNEPMAIPLAGYLTPGPDRSNPPGLSLDAARGKIALHNLILGHAAITDAVRAEDPDAEVGLVMNMVAIEPFAPEEADDQLAVDHMDHLYHRLFLDGVTTGAWDEDLDGTFETTRPELVGRLDWVGVNYYAVVTVRGLPAPILDELPVFDFFPDIAWFPAADRFPQVTGRAAAYGLPVYITENGLSSDDEQARATLLEDSLRALQATATEQDLRGFFYWSFVDNYEWNHGMTAYHFGIYGLDPVTKERLPRPIRDRYRAVAEANGFPAP
jgi:beta-glucosidase/6-phospho-beta-glucosidase/beta-galactosidase